MSITGIAFPLAIDPAKGNLITASEGELFRGHILSWLLTEPFSRVMVPNYGLKDQLFSSISNISEISAAVLEGLKKYIPGVKFEVNGSIDDFGEATINVYWEYQDINDSISIAIK